jgi:hypothetical protein
MKTVLANYWDWTYQVPGIKHGLRLYPVTFLHPHTSFMYTLANERLVRIQNKCLVPIYVFPEMKLRGLVISKTEF